MGEICRSYSENVTRLKLLEPQCGIRRSWVTLPPERVIFQHPYRMYNDQLWYITVLNLRSVTVERMDITRGPRDSPRLHIVPPVLTYG